AVVTIEIVRHVREQSPLSGATFAVQLALADRARPSGIAWPTIATIAQDSRWNEKTVSRAIREMEEEDLLLVRRHQWDRVRGGVPSLYLLVLPSNADICAAFRAENWRTVGHLEPGIPRWVLSAPRGKGDRKSGSRGHKVRSTIIEPSDEMKNSNEPHGEIAT